MKFNGIMIGTADAKALADFYTKVFGQPIWNDGGWYGFGSKDNAIVIGFHSEVKGQNPSPARIMLNLQTDDVQGEFNRIKDAGAKAVAEPYQPDAEGAKDVWIATLADPDGNYLQLATPWES